jgi:hypothetical protein
MVGSQTSQLNESSDLYKTKDIWAEIIKCQNIDIDREAGKMIGPKATNALKRQIWTLITNHLEC